MRPNPRLGVVTDSNSQITAELVADYSIEVVPMSVTVDGTEYLEGVDIDADGFYALFEHDTPDVSTSQPPPGAFVAAYERLADRGVTEIISIHIADDLSGTLASARLAADQVDVPVHLVDAGTASFGTAVAAWSAAETIRRGGNVDDVRRRIASLRPRLGTAFMIGVPALATTGGRAEHLGLDERDDGHVPIVTACDGTVEVLDGVHSTKQAVEVLARYATGWGDSVTVAIGVSDDSGRPLARSLARALDDAPNVDALVHYRVGPSIGAHMGPGTFGLFVFPTMTRRAGVVA